MGWRFYPTINSINVKIFALFWLIWFSFFALMGIAFFIPTMDARNLNALSEEDIHFFQTKVIRVSTDNTLHDLQYFDSNTPESSSAKDKEDKKQAYRVALVNPNNYDDVLGAPNPEQAAALFQFVRESADPLVPKKRRFSNLDVVGPFVSSYPFTDAEPYLLYFIETVNPQREFVNFIFDHPLVMLSLLMVTSTPLLILLIFSLTRPIKRLRNAANDISNGHLQVMPELEKSGPQELREVGKSFNQMISSVDNVIHSQQRLLSDISHELRTPLTRLQLATSLLRRRNGETTEVTRIETEIERMDKMIAQLLQMSRHYFKIEINRTTFPIIDIWENVVEDAYFESQERNIIFVFSQFVQRPEKLFMLGNSEVLARALENVIRNAFKYASGEVHLTTTQLHGSKLEILVDDNGKGVPDTEYERIFKPFYRTDEARARTTGGTGLGLSIVANAIEQHGGSVKASKSPLGGLRIRIILPIKS
ncbi:envelope stress sensor histidine kinase CpxA [Pasteurellaceae bacterium 20609_3]|uniref:envelope stress sensor histidine kinase CpxA n=1 Tax=Spirabiliibacterium mucosae TaxID=28156 RepID=UPI001AAC7BBC|nr:envelope stress sensor histidine kinase CpxA [Spirabiliibacterium mucosae]MBE2897618.1 envelope stress sensor histidine kinase CpxA [Spirabiliibacterium mucosae]